MFDIGISEIAVIAVVALVVIGPERLPKVARTVGTLLGRAQRYVNDVKAEVNREMELEELKKLQTQMQDAARGIQEQVSTAGAEMQSAVHDMEKQLHAGATPEAESPANAPEGTPSATAEAGHQATGDGAGFAPLTEPPPDAALPVAEPRSPEPRYQATAETPLAAPLPEPSAAATVAAAPAAAEPSQPDDRPVQASLFPEHTVR